MRAIPWFVLLSMLTACSTAPMHAPTDLRRHGPTERLLVIPSDAPRQDEVGETIRAPVGIGFTASPSTVLFGAAVDVPIQENLTVGPAIEYGRDGSDEVFTLIGQAKYFLTDQSQPVVEDQRLLPFVSAGVGFGHLDIDNRDDESGVVVTGGAGVRYLMGESYQLGSEITAYWAPGEIAGEHFWLGWEVIQVVFEF